ncbi:MAG: hypothetical protein A2Y20_02625 [Firmicutes bacterium GWF2_51_9]|nr:DUF2177 family protein [Erysipelotrichaceae bacterium]OGS54005.1 MAG: hypothetical protein A2Y20_02625 [Firmicutes bacterium GWF2_51_9]OGS57452.1 MAG: hypothetical protein A2Y19_03020 [Firmicutes bacterium GWE2_51_13]HAM63936.1 DUF2177 domain-containing protein [Erysipelotrichaceae bacterium]HAO61760.1 DUF2177 domain-containing protein [Erysipelotrichaceae bacterium]
MKFLLHFVIALVVFFAIDLVWLGLIAKNLYSKYLGFIMSDKVNWIAALIFYALFIVGLLVFVIEPALQTPDLTQLVLRAALFGLVTYATYDLTNLATLKDWPIQITIIDLIWGTTLSTLVSVISVFIIGKL